MGDFIDNFCVLPVLSRINLACIEADIQVDWYVFGSYSRGCASPADIDVLGLVRAKSSILRVKAVTEHILLELPIHLTLLTFDDEKRRAFVEQTQAVKLWL